MPSDVFRYRLGDAVPAADAEATLVLAILAVEALHGEAPARLDAGHAFDPKLRTVVIDASTAVGRDFNRLPIRLVGDGGAEVAHADVVASRRAETAAA